MSLKITLTKSPIASLPKHKATVAALGLKKVGDVTTQPDNEQTNGKIKKISHLVEVTEA